MFVAIFFAIGLELRPGRENVIYDPQAEGFARQNIIGGETNLPVREVSKHTTN